MLLRGLISLITINNTINNKQKFNITVFLNEKCKDAISMNEFVDKDGSVYFKGKEQVELKGTLDPTVIKPKKQKKRIPKKKKESQNRELMAEIYKLKKQLKKATLKKDIKSLEIQIRKINRKLN